jgi:hypothetical protein
MVKKIMENQSNIEAGPLFLKDINGKNVINMNESWGDH